MAQWSNHPEGTNRAATPVLGIALIIAITVTLAGVVGFMVLGADSGSNSGPNAELAFSQSENSTDTYDIRVVHEGGDVLQSTEVEVVITDYNNDGDIGSFKTDLSAGGEQVIVTDSVESGDVVRLVWNDPNTEKTTVLGDYRVE